MKRDGVFSRNGAFYISWVDYYGKRKKRKTDAGNMAEARAARAEELRKVEQARTLGFIPPTTDSFEAKAKEYLQFQEAHLTPDIHDRESGIFRLHLNPFFSSQLKAIQRADVERYLSKRRGAKVAPATIRKELQVLKHMLSFCVEHNYLPASPAAKVKGPEVPETEAAFVPEECFPAFVAACPEWLQPMVMFAVATGFRRRNVIQLEWRDVNLDTSQATLRGTKGKKDVQYFALTELAIAVLKFMMMGQRNILPNSRAKVFPFDGVPGRVSVETKRAAKRAGLPEIHFHSLRHTFGSWAVMNGNDLGAVQRWMGHKTPRMTARYAHLSPSYMQQQLETLNNAFIGVMPLLNSGDAVGTNEGANVSLADNSSHSNKMEETRMNTEENVQVADV